MHVTRTKFLVPLRYLWNGLKYTDFKFGVHVDHGKSQPMNVKLSLKGAWSVSGDFYSFWKIDDNISKTVHSFY